MHLPRHKIPRGKVLLLACVFGAAAALNALVPPHPLYKNPPQIRPTKASELFGPHSMRKGKPFPQSVLVLRAQFTDVTFQGTPVYPDSLVHGTAYFERWMLHLSDFFMDASRTAFEPYILNYAVPDTVFTLSHTMSYYGADGTAESDLKVADMLEELITLADPNFDYNDFDAFIVVHAGPGQESDIDRIRTSEIWSTFMARSDLQYYLDPHNDNYQGIATADGKYIKELILVSESEFQDYFPVPPNENASAYLFSIYGVLCQQFGHQIGLPTMFDNYTTNGASQGIGNWGLMGTGLWNANGYVPAQLDAWSRCYLGWDTPILVTDDAQNLKVDYFLNHSPFAHRIYKIPITEKEYFLVENRQQNPDYSLDPYNNLPSFTFSLLDSAEQDYYADAPLRPYFNFMKNRYKGCEWDFYLPGLGGPLQPWESVPTDGSGLLIWHIDENVIEANFDPEFEQNHINFDASHKGIDVEEADGIQHLDTSTFDYYMYGGPFDTFREDPNPAGNNTYFGQEYISIPDTATPDTTDYVIVTHLPTAASYYGGIPLEIYNISASGNIMTFSVRFGWRLSTGYIGENNLDACSVDYDQDGKNEIFYPMPDGSLFMWKDEEPAEGFPITVNNDLKSYCWDGSAFYLAYAINESSNLPMVNLKKLQGNRLTSLLTKPNGCRWAAPLLTFGDYVVTPIMQSLNNTSAGFGISIFDKENWTEDFATWSFAGDFLATNLAFYKEKIYAVAKSLADSSYALKVISPFAKEVETFTLSIPKDSVMVAMSIAPILPNSEGDIILQTPYSIYLTDLQGNIRNGYPIRLPFFSDAQVTISDTDFNGTFDYLVSGENTFAVYDYSGHNMLTNFSGIGMDDSLDITSGILAGDYDGDGKKEYMGAFSRNRTAVFDHNLRLMGGFPVATSNRSRNLPFVHQASDSLVYVWTATDNGNIFRAELPQAALQGIDLGWYSKYANLQRTSSREDYPADNQYKTDAFFVKGQNFVFPNPLRNIYAPRLTFQIMTSRTAKVEVSVFDIAGKLIYRKNVLCQAYLQNRELIDLPTDKLSGGVYIAVYKSGDKVHRFKFAVEK